MESNSALDKVKTTSDETNNSNDSIADSGLDEANDSTKENQSVNDCKVASQIDSEVNSQEDSQKEGDSEEESDYDTDSEVYTEYSYNPNHSHIFHSFSGIEDIEEMYRSQIQSSPHHDLSRLNVLEPSKIEPRGLINWISKIATKSIYFGFKTFVYFIGFGLTFLEFIGFDLRFITADPKEAITNPVDKEVNLISQCETKYVTNHPTIYQGTYEQAEKDAKKDLKFLLVYIHSDNLNSELFCKHVMTSTEFQNIIDENMLFLCCSNSKPEGYGTSHALRNVTLYPFLGLLLFKKNKMKIVTRIEGKMDLQAVVSRLQQGVSDNIEYLIAARQERSQILMDRALRQNQDMSYIRSLEADQKKERKKQEELDKQKELEKQLELEKQRKIDEEKQRIENIKEEKSIASMTLKPEPAPDHPDSIRTLVKLPNGSKLERRFLKTDSLKHLYQYVFCHSESPNVFDIVANFPKRILPCKETSDCAEPPSFIEAQIASQEVLFVYDLET